MFAIDTELRGLVVALYTEQIPYALCGALAMAVYGHPRATLDIDLLALAGSAREIRRCARTCGFTLEAAPMTFAAGAVRIERISKAIPGNEDVLILDVLSLSPQIEQQIEVKTVLWLGAPLKAVSRDSLVQLKQLRGSLQDLADIEKLR